MNLTPPLTGAHLRTYDRIYQHPISHNLEWREVHALLAKLGEVIQEHNGNLKATRNGHVLVLHAPRHKDITEMDEVLMLRHFLTKSEEVQAATNEVATHWLLVIDHHEARLFRTEAQDAIPQRILPPGPGEYFRHAKDSKENSRGQEKPDANSFFELVAKALQSPGPILIFGTGTGTSSEMEQFKLWAGTHHPELAKRVIRSVNVDEHHLSEGQLVAKAREIYAGESKSIDSKPEPLGA